MDSILISIKKLLGIEEDYTHFDQDIIISINTCFVNLFQIGVGPINGFSISDSTAIWIDWDPDEVLYNNVKMYIFMKTRLMFDPPNNSFLVKNYEDLLKEVEWRISLYGKTD